jgi:ribosomal protein S18 acetylase RimI-like enzyme
VEATVVEASIQRLAEVGGISIAFETEGGTKDYDRYAGNRPADWANRFDTSDWGLFFAESEGEGVGAAVLRLPEPGLAELWDLRVAPECRGQGVGTALLAAAEEWSSARGCDRLRVETQDVNVAACRFYESHGFELRERKPGAYPECPNEVQLLWYKDLQERRDAS